MHDCADATITERRIQRANNVTKISIIDVVQLCSHLAAQCTTTLYRVYSKHHTLPRSLALDRSAALRQHTAGTPVQRRTTRRARPTRPQTPYSSLAVDSSAKQSYSRSLANNDRTHEWTPQIDLFDHFQASKAVNSKPSSFNSVKDLQRRVVIRSCFGHLPKNSQRVNGTVYSRKGCTTVGGLFRGVST